MKPAACLAESNTASLADYLPPAGISRRGAVGTQPRRRTYDRGKETIDDAALSAVLPLLNGPLSAVLAEAVAAHLRRATLGLLEE